MEKIVKKIFLVCGLVFAAVLVADQVLKIWVKTHMLRGENIPLIGQWCQLHVIENEGMAFGIQWGGNAGKLVLSLVRIAASGFIVYLICKHIKKPDTHKTLLASMTLILVGAVGNLVDSCFYGLIFNESYPTLATLFPDEGGYGRFLYGRVVDMFYFPLFEYTWPQWIPFVGGEHGEFFSAIFNVADSAITIGVILLLIDQLILVPRDKKREQPSENNNITSIKKEKDSKEGEIAQNETEKV